MEPQCKALLHTEKKAYIGCFVPYPQDNKGSAFISTIPAKVKVGVGTIIVNWDNLSEEDAWAKIDEFTKAIVTKQR